MAANEPLTEPIDAVHTMCVEAIVDIRHRAAQLQAQVRNWDIAPMPITCPFGHPVGDPPAVARCPLGFPGCACGDEMVRHLTGEADEQSTRVVEWWETHSHEF